MSETVKKIAKLAAEWWADKVINPEFDNGDDSSSGAFGRMLAKMTVKEVDPEARSKFIEHLSNAIETKLADEKYDWVTFTLGTDYHPDMMLREAAEYAGISTNNFPWKTCLWYSKSHVSVSLGYRGKTEYLYSNKAHWQHQIDSCNRGIEDYRSRKMNSWIKDEEERKQETAKSIARLEKSIEEYQIELEKAEA